MKYTGIDYHKRYSVACTLDEQGRRVHERGRKGVKGQKRGGRKGVKLCTLHWTRRSVARRTEGCRENLGWNLRERFTT